MNLPYKTPFLFFCVFSFCAAPPPLRADGPRPYLQSLIQEAHARNLAEQRYWQLLLHVHRDLLGRFRSEINDKRFFISPKGRTNRSAELDATLKAFFDPLPADPDVQHPQCMFPARYAWLKEQLHFDSRLPEQPCPRFEAWRDQMNAGSVTLVFASYYLNNPASMYGHTFLRLNARNHTEKQRLLDYTVNFAAQADTENGLFFAVKGLLGGYPGHFSTMPYYMKVQEYNNLEYRDLWEYGLNLDQASVDRLVLHLWEMGQASMAYFFLNKNCSYQLLPVLEAAQPSLHLVDPFWFKAIPVDTLRQVIYTPGLLSTQRVRPSHVSKMLAGRSELSGPEVRVAEKLAKKANSEQIKTLESFPRDRQVKILDSAYDLFRYRAGFERKQPPAVQEQERLLLLTRNQLGLAVSSGPIVEPPESTKGAGADKPDHGHLTGRAMVSYGFSQRAHFEELSLRSALHDLDDNSGGYIPGSQLQMFHLRLRYENDRKKFYTQEFTLIDILSLSPWDRWVRKPSWGVHTGAETATELGKEPENSLYYGLRTGPGFSYQSHLWRKELFYVLAEADAGVGGVFDENYRLGGGSHAGVSVEAASWWRIHFDTYYFRYPVGDSTEAVKLRLIQSVPLGRSAQLRVTLERQNQYKEALFSFVYYL